MRVQFLIAVVCCGDVGDLDCMFDIAAGSRNFEIQRRDAEQTVDSDDLAAYVGFRDLYVQLSDPTCWQCLSAKGMAYSF